MFKSFLIAPASVCLSLPALATTGYTTVVSTQMTDGSGQPLASGTATLRVVDHAGNPLSVKLTGGAQIITAPFTAAVTNGAFSIPSIDVSQSVPSFACVQLTVTNDADGSVVWQNNCLQPVGNTYSLDQFTTSTTPIYPQAGDTVPGNLSVNGNLSVTGNLAMGGLTATTFSAVTTDGVFNAAQFAGSDIGAKVNAVFAIMPSGGGTVFIPAGSYSFSTTMALPGPGFHLDCDAGSTLTYTGSGDAIAIGGSAFGNGNVSIDGHGGCNLIGTSKTGNGIDMKPSNTTYVQGMRITGFNNGIYLSGGNSVQIDHDSIYGNNYAIHTITAPGYAPNAVHVSQNEISSNGWGYYSEDGHVSASHALGNVIRDNVFEQNITGDVYLGWDAEALVQGNYFESFGVGVSAGAGAANVFQIQIRDNYFTSNGYRSEIELGYSFDVVIEHNYEEGATSATSGCKINIVSGSSGSFGNVRSRDAFAYAMEGGTGVPPTPNDLCDHGTPITAFTGTDKFQDNVQVNGSLNIAGAEAVTGNATFLNGVQAGAGSKAIYNGGSTGIPTVGSACVPEGYQFNSTTSPAHLLFCSGGSWRQVY